MNLSNINFNSVLNTLAAKAKALALNVTEIELKVLEATNEEPWGPHGKDMQEIARAAEEPEKYNLIMNVISERLQARDENWRLCYKALLLLEFMVKHGPWRVVDELQRSVSSLERLRDEFEYKDQQGRDQGINVRQRAGELATLVCNTERVRQEREKAARNANKFKGVSSSDVRGGFGSGNYSGGGGGSSYGYGGFGGGGGFGSSGFGSGGGGGGSRSQRQPQGFGSTESVHKPYNSFGDCGGSGSSHSFGSGPASSSAGAHRNDGFRAAAADNRGAAGGAGGDEAEDPFEATRKRIERLKAEGALQESANASAPPGLVDPAAASGKVLKKLSDVKINPAVAATFASISIPASSNAPSLAKLAPPPGPGVPVKPASGGGSTTLDLFGDALSSGPQPSMQPPLPQQESGAAASTLGWDATFGTAAPSGGAATGIAAAAPTNVASPADPFADFASAAPALAAPASTCPADGFGSLFGSDGGGGAGGGGGFSSSTSATAPAAAATRPSVREPLPFDAFSELEAPAPAAAPLPALGFPSSAKMPVAKAPAADPFAALASSSAPAPPMAATAWPTPAAAGAAADPFAVLSVPRAAAPTPMAPPPKPAPGAALPFDAFGMAAPPPARTPQAPAAAAADPFAALASSSTPASMAMPAAVAARAAAAAALFDPFETAPAPTAVLRPAAPAPAFDAFGSMAVPPQPQPAAAASSSFDDFFGGGGSPGKNGQRAAPAAAAPDPFAASFNAFPPPPASAAVTPVAAVAANGAGLAMNKSGAALGAAGHRSHDPFAGLGF